MQNPYDLGPPDMSYDPTPLQEAVWGILEDAGVDDDTMNKIDAIIADWEKQQEEAVIEDQILRRQEGVRP